MLIVGPFQLSYSILLRRGAQDVTITLGKMALCSHCFRPKQGSSGAADQKTMTVGRELGPSFGKKEKMGERQGQAPCSRCSSPTGAPLLFQHTAYRLAFWFPGCLVLCSSYTKADYLAWLLHPSTRQLNPQSLPYSACFCQQAVIAAEAASDLEWGRELFSAVAGGGRVIPGDRWCTRFATPPTCFWCVSEVPCWCSAVAGHRAYLQLGELGSKSTGCNHNSLWFSLTPSAAPEQPWAPCWCHPCMRVGVGGEGRLQCWWSWCLSGEPGPHLG